VVLAETQAPCVIAMGKSKDRLNAAQIKIQRTDGMSLLRQLPLQSQDLVFLDPPYDSALYEQALKYAHACLKPAGFAYLESNKAWSEEALQALGWKPVRYLKAGSVHAHLLQTAA
jgi:16S rRNA G966 N2-methylase RsmD